MNFESLGGGTRTGSSPGGRETTTCGIDVAGGVGAGIVAVGAPGTAATASAVGTGGRVLMPATPPGDAQAPAASTAPATIVNRAMCRDRMLSTRVTLSRISLYLCNRPSDW
ncbi:hypothetical protein GCM10017673_05280 [Streptosporangium violaceochromogenes]|nr:hypothetical protein GCM10017673_05280 [Streptosporangium violaceochromogenes]